MATGITQNRSNQLNRLTTCPICLDKFRIPKVLPCMHTFCLTPCLTNLIDARDRTFRCPECRREHQIPPGGVQAFPSNITMNGVLDLQPTRNIDLPDRCFICKQQKQTLIECQDCAQYVCTNCRERHLREAFSNISGSINQLRRAVPRVREKMSSYEQRVNNIKTNYEQNRRDITSTISNLIDELKQRETVLMKEAEANMQSQLRTCRVQQDGSGMDLSNIANFCESVGTSYPNGHLINDTDLANIRARCNHYSQQIDSFQVDIPTDIQKLRIVFDNQAVMYAAVQNYGRLIDPSQRQQQQPQYSSTTYPQSATRYATTAQNSRNNRAGSRNSQNRQLENYNQSNDLLSQTIGYLPRRNHAFEDMDDPFRDLSASLPPNAGPRRKYVTSTTAARSLEGDDRPIFGGAGRGRSRAPTFPPIYEQDPRTNSFQRNGTFVLDEPSLPNLPQSGAQKLRDKVNVKELYNVRRRKRVRTPIAFTVNLNDPPPPSRGSEVIDTGTG